MIMRRTKADHKPDHVLSDYLERAIDESGLRLWFNLLQPGAEAMFDSISRSNVEKHLNETLSPWRTAREGILRYPEKHLNWHPGDDLEEAIKNAYRFDAAVIAAIMGKEDGLRTLGAQLVIEHMNVKLMLTYFLGNLTDGKVGLTYKSLPNKTQVLQWVRDIDQVEISDRLSELAKLRLE